MKAESVAAYAADPGKRGAAVVTSRAKNPEKHRLRRLAYKREHPEEHRAYTLNRQARKAGNGGGHTGEDVRAQLERQGGRCFYCRKKVDAYHEDHVIPLAKGGSNGPENLVIACPTCNLRKGAKHPMDFCGRLL